MSTVKRNPQDLTDDEWEALTGDEYVEMIGLDLDDDSDEVYRWSEDAYIRSLPQPFIE